MQGSGANIRKWDDYSDSEDLWTLKIFLGGPETRWKRQKSCESQQIDLGWKWDQELGFWVE